jgi:outer membrane lipoprotein-sorting protein
VKKLLFSLAAATLVASAVPHPAVAADALTEAAEAYAKVNDYTATIIDHEVKGSQDRTYRYAFLKPSYVKLDITAGPGRGGGAVWTGGDQVSGHQGGLFSGIHLKVGVHDGRATSLRGDTIDSGTIGAMLNMFKNPKGTVTESDEKTVDGVLTDELSLKLSDQEASSGVTRVDLYLSRATHLPIRREFYVGDQLVKSEQVTDQKVNTGLKPSDFPF